MSIEVLMPKLGMSMEEGNIVKWFKQEGESIASEELLLEIESDKITMEVTSPAAGKVSKLLCAEGDTVPVGTAVAVIEPA
jgi:pyruvate/2-oxoglutarate dehydrogenase complex dihydrolipoamide acyltransferase (E2) component